jgi:hypothetical protein
MARIRTVKPDLFGSYSLSSIAIEARYLFIGLFTEADDYGILIDSPKRLVGAIFPHDEKVTANKVNAWLSDLERVGSITRYEVNGGRYICLPEWANHQRISHPSKATLPTSSGDLPEALPPERKGKEGKGIEDPLTPTSGGTDASHTPRAGMRGSGTSRREIQQAEEAKALVERKRQMAYDFGARRVGNHDDPNEVLAEARLKWPGEGGLHERAVQGFVDERARQARSDQ